MNSKFDVLGWLPLLALIVCMAGCVSSNAQSDEGKSGRSAKIGSELLALYDEYSRYMASGKRGVFKPSSPLVQVVDSRVVVDAVASDDANALKSDLEALGMKQAVAFGRVVSGQLPILAIPSMAKLFSLNSVRAATAVLQETPRSASPGTPRG